MQNTTRENAAVHIPAFALEYALRLVDLERVTFSGRAESLQDVISHISAPGHILCSTPTHTREGTHTLEKHTSDH